MKLTKKQIGHNVAMRMLGILEESADHFRKVLDKGIGADDKPLGCAPADIKSALQGKQLELVQKFIHDFASENGQKPHIDKPG